MRGQRARPVSGRRKRALRMRSSSLGRKGRDAAASVSTAWPAIRRSFATKRSRARCAAVPWRCVRNSALHSLVCRLHGRLSSWWRQTSCAGAGAWRSWCRRPSVMRLTPARFGALADIGLGYVSGANGFFHLKPSDSRRAHLPQGLLQTTVHSARLLPRRQLTAASVERWRRDDEPMLLLRIPKAASVPAPVQRYLDTAAGQSARQAYKCRHRTPWYSVPDVRVPDFFLTYMAGLAPNLVRNAARASCSNALHGVRLKRPMRTGDLLDAWQVPLTQLSCELEGHALGGGMLKLELREAACVVLPLARTRKPRPMPKSTRRCSPCALGGTMPNDDAAESDECHPVPGRRRAAVRRNR